MAPDSSEAKEQLAVPLLLMSAREVRHLVKADAQHIWLLSLYKPHKAGTLVRLRGDHLPIGL